MHSITVGYRCERCGCYFDIYGNFHSPIQQQIMEVKTNADKIRSMTDEELAKFLADGFDCEGCKLSYVEDIWHETHCNGKHNECWKNLLEWLKQPAEGE